MSLVRTSMKHVVPAVVLAVTTLQSPTAQSAITGRVVVDDSGDPVANARVVLNVPGSTDRVVAMSDRDGRFSLLVPPGRHNIVATKPRFARGEVTVEVRLRRGAAISGRIIDEFGDPVVAARVFVETPRTAAAVATTGTDDRGEYRIGGLSAGMFSVAVLTIGPAEIRPLGGGRFAMNPVQMKTYYPNATTSTEAQSIAINWGDERTGVDLVLPAGRAGFQPFDVGRRGPGPLNCAAAPGCAPGSAGGSHSPTVRCDSRDGDRDQRPPVAVRGGPPRGIAGAADRSNRDGWPLRVSRTATRPAQHERFQSWLLPPRRAGAAPG
jgi:hypothetical protein